LQIILDSSGSISSENYNTSLDFVYRLSKGFIGNRESKLGFYVYSTTFENVIPLSSGLTEEQLRRSILSAPHLKTTTRTDLALLDAANNLRNNRENDIPMITVVITDAKSDDPTATRKVAESVKLSGIRMYSVGIGITEESAQKELTALAGGPSYNVFNVKTWDKLIDIVTTTSARLCAP